MIEVQTLDDTTELNQQNLPLDNTGRLPLDVVYHVVSWNSDQKDKFLKGFDNLYQARIYRDYIWSYLPTNSFARVVTFVSIRKSPRKDH